MSVTSWKSLAVQWIVFCLTFQRIDLPSWLGLSPTQHFTHLGMAIRSCSIDFSCWSRAAELRRYANPDCELEQPQDCRHRGLPRECHTGLTPPRPRTRPCSRSGYS